MKEVNKAWFYSINYRKIGFVVNGRKLVISPNLLRQFKNIIPFGLSCTSTDGLEPYFLDDFTNVRITLYTLNATEVKDIENSIYEK